MTVSALSAGKFSSIRVIWQNIIVRNGSAYRHLQPKPTNRRLTRVDSVVGVSQRQLTYIDIFGAGAAPNPKNGNDGMERLYEHTLQKQLVEQKNEIALLKDQNARMEAQAAEIKDQNAEILALLRQQRSEGAASSSGEGAAVTQNGNNNVALVDNKKITINVFGKEDVGHISAVRIMAEEIFPDGHTEMSEPSGLEKIS
ncbi:MAG: hypothetical protein L7S63_02325 [Flavobacteriales bacterium]|nr:hypothetical protein [Flavobacteriales bacterium]